MANPDPTKLALAKSIAVNGSQGPAIFKTQQADLAAQKQGAIDAASSRAGLINAPDAFLKQQAAQLSEPYNTASTKSSANASALNSYLGSMNSANSNYLSQLQAVAPLVQAQVDKAQSGANINQLLQLLNLKNAQEDRAYSLEQRKLAQEEKINAANNLAVQQRGFNSILNHANANFRDTGVDIINQSDDLPGALSKLYAIKDKDLKKSGINRDELRRSLIQYFDPETFAQLPAVQAPTPVAVGQAKTSSSNSSPTKTPSYEEQQRQLQDAVTNQKAKLQQLISGAQPTDVYGPTIGQTYVSAPKPKSKKQRAWDNLRKRD